MTAVDVQLAVNLPHVPFHSSRGEIEALCNFIVVERLHDELKHIEFAFGERNRSPAARIVTRLYSRNCHPERLCEA